MQTGGTVRAEGEEPQTPPPSSNAPAFPAGMHCVPNEKLLYPFAGGSKLEASLRGLFERDTKAIIWGQQQKAIQVRPWGQQGNTSRVIDAKS